MFFCVHVNGKQATCVFFKKFRSNVVLHSFPLFALNVNSFKPTEWYNICIDLIKILSSAEISKWVAESNACAHTYLYAAFRPYIDLISWRSLNDVYYFMKTLEKSVIDLFFLQNCICENLERHIFTFDANEVRNLVEKRCQGCIKDDPFQSTCKWIHFNLKIWFLNSLC